ncbi:MAG: hypothetical protein KC656_20965 [Myxococcales bacterium]|nr:hypothetical protein [Myxococcales bacterium]MCB9672842.1 hypothetical protein [Alphaproteobacteria bacterium]
MLWMLVLGCSCGANPAADLQPRHPVGDVKADPARLAGFPKCVSYGDAVCEVCGPASDACLTIQKVNAMCSQRGSCQEDSCESGEKRLRADPKGASSELCTE